MLKYIMQHVSLSEHFKYIGESTPKLCKFKMNYVDKIDKLYRAFGLVHSEQ